MKKMLQQNKTMFYCHLSGPARDKSDSTKLCSKWTKRNANISRYVLPLLLLVEKNQRLAPLLGIPCDSANRNKRRTLHLSKQLLKKVTKKVIGKLIQLLQREK
ncbi:hypothetical protein ACET3Z_000255 [Daucus carota]